MAKTKYIKIHGVDIKYQTIHNIPHYVFKNREDFETYFMAEKGSVPKIIDNWKECREGDWVEADDGGIVQILKAKGIANAWRKTEYANHKGYCRTIVGTFFRTKYATMDTDFSKHPSRYRFTGVKNKSTIQFIKDRIRPTLKERRFVYSILTGKDPYIAYRDIYGQGRELGSRVTLLLKQERIQKLMQENLEDIAKRLGIDHEYILSEIKELAEAQKGKNSRLTLDCLDKLGNAIGTFGNDVKTTTHGALVFQGFGNGEIEQIQDKEITKQLEEVGE